MPANLFTQLSIYSGSLYLDSVEEEEEYLLFLGYCPHPRNAEQEACFETEKILKNGFVPMSHREIVYRSVLREHQTLSKFEDEPSGLVQRIICLRNYGIVPESAHHNIIFKNNQRPFSAKM